MTPSRLVLIIDNVPPLSTRTDHGDFAPPCRAGCGSPARYRGYCFRHWRQWHDAPPDPEDDDAAFAELSAACRSNREALRRLTWQDNPSELVQRLHRRCAELGLPTPAQQTVAYKRAQAGRRGRRHVPARRLSPNARLGRAPRGALDRRRRVGERREVPGDLPHARAVHRDRVEQSVGPVAHRQLSAIG
jgi:hypothetical protein